MQTCHYGVKKSAPARMKMQRRSRLFLWVLIDFDDCSARQLTAINDHKGYK